MCLTQCLVYKATSTTSNNSFVYYKTSGGEFKTRYNNHTKLFKHCECMNETELYKHVWNLKDHGFDNSLSSEIHKKRPHHKKWSSKCCSLPLSEKLPSIVLTQTLLNKQTKLILKCRHKNKFLSADVKK